MLVVLEYGVLLSALFAFVLPRALTKKTVGRSMVIPHDMGWLAVSCEFDLAVVLFTKQRPKLCRLSCILMHPHFHHHMPSCATMQYIQRMWHHPVLVRWLSK